MTTLSRMWRWYSLLIGCIVLTGVLCQEENAVPGTDNETTSAETTPIESDSTDPPREVPILASSNETFNRQAGERVVMPCVIQNLEQSRAVPIWKHGDKIISTGTFKMGGTPQAHLNTTTYELTIRRITEQDAGLYTCTAAWGVTPEQFVAYTLNIVSPPSVDIRDGDKGMTVKEGDNLLLKCNTNGTPAPTSKWILTTHSGVRRELSEFENMGEIEVKSMSDDKAGIYTCEASNGVGNPATDQITVHVLSAPKLLDHSAVFLSEVGGKARLHCSFSAYPITGHELRWYSLTKSTDPTADPSAYEEEEMIMDDTHYVVHSNVTATTMTSTLTINDVKSSDLRKYKCRAKNEVDPPAEHIVELSGLAFPVGDVRFTEKRDGVLFTMRSANPVKEYHIIYREYNETHQGDPRNQTIVEDNKSVKVQDGIKFYEKTYVFENLQPLKNYSVVIQALNDYGLSDTVTHNFILNELKPHAGGLTGSSNSVLKSSHWTLRLTFLWAVIASWIALRS